jgi:beta-lactamase regulating signal transducer with metallopeptidase domain
MCELFLSVLNMSLTASYVILFVILIRLALKKAPKVISYALWGVVAFRLIIPFTFESMFSLMPRNTNAVPIPHNIIYQQSPQINSGIEIFDPLVNGSLPAPIIGASVNPLQIYVEIGAYIWVLGIIALLVYSLVSILILKRQLKSAQLIENNIFEAKNLKTPFLLGLIRPKIYLPDGLNDEERSYILLHEQTHIHRKDHIIKILAFLTLSIHWFNPLVWIAFMLMSADMELSCDEVVLKEMNEDIKKPYANSLLSLATGKHILNGSPLAFGEGNVKGRIKNVLNYKRPRFWIIVFSIIIVATVGIGLVANPKTKGTYELEQITDIAWEFINKNIANYESNPEADIIDSKIIRLELIETFDKLADTPIDVYALEYRLLPEDLSKVVLAGGMDVDEKGWLKENSSMGRPLIVVLRNYGSVELVGILWTGEVPGKLGLDSAIKSLLEPTALVPTATEWSLEQTVSVDMAELDYASDAIVILHDYFGLFVYDLNTLQIIRSLDLKPLNCNQTQGDNYCDVSVSMDGHTVQLHPMSSENMFVYTVLDNTLQETTYKPMKDSFRDQFVPIEEVINSTKLGNFSHLAVRFDTGEYGYLHTEDGTIGTLSYVRGDMVFRLFDIKASLSDRRPMIMVNGILYLDTGEQVPVGIDDSAIIGEISSLVDQSEKPTEEGQSNFGSLGSKYAYYEENIVVLINNKWVLFKREQSTENVLNQLANQDFSIEGENLYNADDETIVEFGKAFINLFNGAVAEQKKVSFEKYISKKNLLKFTDKMLELTQKQDLLGGNTINYGLKNEFNQAKLQHMEDNLCYLELKFEFEGSGMGCKMLITTENKSLKLVDLYFGSKDGVDTFATGHPAEREINDSNLWENEEWVKGVFNKLEDFDERLGS